MNRAVQLLLVAATFAVASFARASAGELIAEAPRGCAGRAILDAAAGSVRWESPPAATTLTTPVYDNLGAPGILAISASDPHAVWGDSLEISQTGIVQEFTLSIYNSNLSAGPISQAQFLFTIRDAATHLDLGNFVFTVGFENGLQPGFYAFATMTGLGQAVQPLELTTTHLIVEQSVLSSIGGDRMGVVSLSPPTIGSSPPSMYIDASTAFGGVPGFYSFAGGPADPAYQLMLNVVDAVRPASWGRVKRLYR